MPMSSKYLYPWLQFRLPTMEKHTCLKCHDLRLTDFWSSRSHWVLMCMWREREDVKTKGWHIPQRGNGDKIYSLLEGQLEAWARKTRCFACGICLTYWSLFSTLNFESGISVFRFLLDIFPLSLSLVSVLSYLFPSHMLSLFLCLLFRSKTFVLTVINLLYYFIPFFLCSPKVWIFFCFSCSGT